MIIDRTTLNVKPERIEYVYDTLDTNALHCITADGYFDIQRCVYIDPKDDLIFKKPYIELDEQNGIYCDFEEVQISANSIHITLERYFLSDYKHIIINMTEEVDLKTIDFFVNHLFLGDVVKYAEDIGIDMHIEQTEFPDQF